MIQYPNFREWSPSDLSSMLHAISGSVGAYDEWIMYGMCVHHAMPTEEGFRAWYDWSVVIDGKCSEVEAHMHWKSFKESGKRTIATLYKFAHQCGWRPEKEPFMMSDEIIAERKAETERKAANERKRKQREGERCANIWQQHQKLSPASEGNAYLSRKGIKPHGIKFGSIPLMSKEGRVYDSEDGLIIPLVDIKGMVKNLQRIDAEGRKKFVFGAEVPCNFYKIDGTADCIVFCEGFATGASIHEVTGYTVIVCFAGFNLDHVMGKFREAELSGRFIVAADNDQYGKKNTGVENARKAAYQHNAFIVIPEFKKETIMANMNEDGKGPKDFNDLHQLEGKDAVMRIFNPPVEPREAVVTSFIKSEHFTYLGVSGTSNWFLNHRGMTVQSITFNGLMNKANLASLAPQEWWMMNYSKSNGQIDWDRAGFDLQEKSFLAGDFSMDKLRKRGAWIDKSPGVDGYVFHTGDAAYVNGNRYDLDNVDSDYVYVPGLSDSFKISSDKFSEDDLRILSHFSDSLPWTHPINGALYLGFLALAPICGAMKWRPHVWLTGESGSGKSTIITTTKAILGRGILSATGGTTEAGIRQMTTGMNVPVISDDFDTTNPDKLENLNKLVELARQSASPDGAQITMGGQNGTPVVFTNRSMFMISSISHTLKNQADEERFSILELHSKEYKGPERKDWGKVVAPAVESVESSEGIGSRLLNHMTTNIAAILKNIEVLKSSASEFFGNRRRGDQVGTLLGGFMALENINPIDREQADEYIRSFNWDPSMLSTDGTETDSVFGELMAIKVRSETGDLTISRCVKNIVKAKGENADVAMRLYQGPLENLGIIIRNIGQERYLMINPKSSEISSSLRHTKFGGTWSNQVRRAEGVVSGLQSGLNIRINSKKCRPICIPFSMISASD